jgi:hypothetical protein
VLLHPAVRGQRFLSAIMKNGGGQNGHVHDLGKFMDPGRLVRNSLLWPVKLFRTVMAPHWSHGVAGAAGRTPGTPGGAHRVPYFDM